MKEKVNETTGSQTEKNSKLNTGRKSESELIRVHRETKGSNANAIVGMHHKYKNE